MEFQGNLMVQTQENGEKPYFGPNLGPLDPNLGRQLFCQKYGVESHYISWSAIIICNIRKTNHPISRKFSDERTDRRANGQTDRWTDRRTRVIS